MPSVLFILFTKSGQDQAPIVDKNCLGAGFRVFSRPDIKKFDDAILFFTLPLDLMREAC